jgi:hypothetical protein
MRFAPLILLALLLPACSGSSSAPTGPVDVKVVVAPGQLVGVVEAGVSVRFEGVVSDSRCPGNATCITAGDAVVRISVSAAGGASATYDLHTFDRKAAKHGDVSIAIDNLSPYPFTFAPISPGDYRATLRLTRG